MRTLIFSVLLALCIAFVRAGGDAYEITHYGGSDDHNRELNPSCLDTKRPDTDYYAAVSTTYEKDLCNKYAVIMGVIEDNPKVGHMVRVRIVDSCHECERSHIDVSSKAFEKVGELKSGRFKIIWVAADKSGNVYRDVVYPSSQTEKFAKNQFGLSKEKFVSMFKKQALKMIRESRETGKFDKYDVPRTTTTTRRTTTTTTTTTRTTPASNPTTEAPIINESTIESFSNITTSEIGDNTIPEDAPIVGQSQVIDPNKTDYTKEDIKVLEDQFQREVEEKDNGKKQDYSAGILTVSSITISGAAGIGLLYLKKKSPSKYEELKQKFPDAFGTIKRRVTRSSTSIRRGVTRTASSIRGKKTTKDSRHGQHEFNYREMPEHMFGEDGLPRIELHDEPMMRDFPEATIKL